MQLSILFILLLLLTKSLYSLPIGFGMMIGTYGIGKLIDRDFRITRMEVIRRSRRDSGQDVEASQKSLRDDSDPTSGAAANPNPTDEKAHVHHRELFAWFGRTRGPKSREAQEVDEELKTRLQPDQLLDFPVERARLRSVPLCELMVIPFIEEKLRIGENLLADSAIFYGCTIAYGWTVQARVSLAVPLILQFIRMSFVCLSVNIEF